MAMYSAILVLLAASMAMAQQCGVTNIAPNITRTRVVGGTEARPNSYPWMVSLQRPFEGKMEHSCGGTLIRASDTKEESDIILTAAHCLDEKEPDLHILLGGHNLLKPSPGQQLVRAHPMVKKHERWGHKDDSSKLANDIAIVKLAQPIKFNQTIQPACLPEPGEQLAEGARTIVTGWGLLEFSGKHPDTLQQAIVPVYNTQQCMREVGLTHLKVQLCAGYSQGKIDSCSQDSGGPLVLKNPNNRYVVHGVVSFGEKCALANNPGVYTRVSAYIPWIKQQVKAMTNVK